MKNIADLTLSVQMITRLHNAGDGIVQMFYTFDLYRMGTHGRLINWSTSWLTVEDGQLQRPHANYFVEYCNQHDGHKIDCTPLDEFPPMRLSDSNIPDGEHEIVGELVTQAIIDNLGDEFSESGLEVVEELRFK